ncbi:MAG: hypothetical protein HF982_10170, partial [Desulfobacteraceae bacterium]|nr:hypothetical protein [Desulfobacteraceae bacterium]MBC2719932.1 hypothetical protein [Desulfobacteraceae bacterium]
QVKVQKTGRWAGLLDQGQQGPVKKQEKEAEKKKVEFRLAQQVLEASHKTSSRRAGRRQRQWGRDIGVFQYPLKKNIKRGRLSPNKILPKGAFHMYHKKYRVKP